MSSGIPPTGNEGPRRQYLLSPIASRRLSSGKRRGFAARSSGPGAGWRWRIRLVIKIDFAKILYALVALSYLLLS